MNRHVHRGPRAEYSVNVSAEPLVGAGRDRLRELLDAVVPGDEGVAAVPDMARRSCSSEFHFSREVRRLTGEPPAALRRRIMLERAAWRLGRGEGVAAVAEAEGWSSPEVFSRAFRRSFGIPPSQVAESGRGFRLPAPNGLHFHPPQSLWIDAEPGSHPDAAVSRLMIDHDIADTAHLIQRAALLSKEQWTQEISPGQVVLDWDGTEPSVGAVLGAIVWTKQVWLASIEGRDQPAREHTDPAATTPQALAAHHDDVSRRWLAMVTEVTARGRLSDTVIDALCDPPESFQLFGIVAHVLTYSAHRRELARTMLARLGVPAGLGDPLDWMRSR
ncbi:helix-turn-helix domain-containing protein [Mycobacterium sp. ACS4331]|uniref:helix-turn-helix domain-containing protein n=1 Tax=Mycobacterium sp. ACS4331 TaxID=1834121 RepID=UPI0009EE0163|nr:helix-turn-helix domain-containing protein [Mycobacterium sp. ACS4331]